MSQLNQWEAFLHRPPITVDRDAIRRALDGSRVLVTGAAGSIGSALARVCAHLPIKELLMLDISEQGIFELELEFEALPKVSRTSFLGDVCDPALLEEIFSVHKPQIVFHAAACKHVPLMERNPFTAARVNSIGTYRVVSAAAHHATEQMVLLSTDKAADPCSIMGATKRIAELIVLAGPGETQMKAVRLGNVLGSSGSVVPLFEKQIAAGGPVTVTHADATRYFITMEEAVWLLLASICEAKCPCIYIPGLQAPQRIHDLARFLIAKSDHAEEVEIACSGLRPGEKLHETLVSAAESIEDPALSALLCVRQNAASTVNLEPVITSMQQAIDDRDLDWLIEAIRRAIPGYKPSAELLRLSPLSSTEKS